MRRRPFSTMDLTFIALAVILTLWTVLAAPESQRLYGLALLPVLLVLNVRRR